MKYDVPMTIFEAASACLIVIIAVVFCVALAIESKCGMPLRTCIAARGWAVLWP